MYIVCVTSCPCGIAHTYMAAANLANTGKAMGHEMKVETQGAAGSENVVTAEDLARADAAIIASDVKIRGLERFDDLPTLEVGVSEAVKDAKKIIEELLEGIG